MERYGMPPSSSGEKAFYCSRQQDKKVIRGISVTEGTIQGEYDIHSHDFVEMVIVLEGAGDHWVNGKLYPVAAGDVFVIFGDYIHGFRSAISLKLINIGFSEGILAAQRDQLGNIPGFLALFYVEPAFRRTQGFRNRFCLDFNGLAEVTPFLSRLVKEYSEGAQGCDLMVWTTFLQLVVIVSRRCSRPGYAGEGSILPISGAVSHIHEHYDSAMSLASLSEMSGMTPEQFSYRFRKIFRTTPVDYINSLRIRKACELLDGTKDTVTRIGMEVGFGDSNYFSRVFRKKTGVSPNRYRANTCRS